jgi:aspartyl aminopeptidase
MKTLITLILVALTPIVLAEAPTDFSGTWKLNTDKGENLGMMKAVKETIVATQSDEQIVLAMTDVFWGMTTERMVTYDLNGKTMQNKAAMGAESETVTSWDGDKLVTIWTSEGAILGTKKERIETRWLSPDGDELFVSMARGDNPAILFVFDKIE